MKEKVWVIDEKIIEKFFGKINDFKKVKYWDLLESLKYAYFLDRDKAEYDPTKKQVIPYVVIRKEESFFVVQRTEKQAEKRLHNLLSVGIGGHINPEDKGDTPEETLINGMNRELKEEISFESNEKPTFIGLIYHEKNEVSKVHIGILYLLNVKEAKIREKDNFIEYWMTKEQIIKVKDKFERWSYIALKVLGVF